MLLNRVKKFTNIFTHNKWNQDLRVNTYKYIDILRVVSPSMVLTFKSSIITLRIGGTVPGIKYMLLSF